MTVRMSRKRSRGRCGECTGCKQPNCGICLECLDMKCFGGSGVKKKACRSRKCVGCDTVCATTTSETNVTKTISKLSSLVHGSGRNAGYFVSLKSVLTNHYYVITGSDHSLQPKAFSRDGLLKVTRGVLCTCT